MTEIDVVLETVNVGEVADLDGKPSAIGKRRVDGPVRVTTLGLVGDHQGDPRVHGGPTKALHYFSAEGYERLAEALPGVDVVPGVLGENIRGRGATEETVCVGDVFALGTAKVQVSRPRTPCWKIDSVLGHDGANKVVAGLRCQGWYYRVLSEGVVSVGDHMTLLERPAAYATLDEILAADGDLRPDAAYVRHLADAEGLDPHIAKRLRGRAQWLERDA